MKILSKYKDYYDYLIGKYGIDSKVVLDRREGVAIKIFNLKPYAGGPEVAPIHVAICGNMYAGFVDQDGNTYWGEAREKVAQLKEIKYPETKTVLKYKDGRNRAYIDYEIAPTTINDELDCPIVLMGGYRGKLRYPCLKEIGIASIIPAEEMYNQLYDWISHRNEPDTTDTRDDKTKIQNAGFDLKKSFRHRQ